MGRRRKGAMVKRLVAKSLEWEGLIKKGVKEGGKRRGRMKNLKRKKKRTLSRH